MSRVVVAFSTRTLRGGADRLVLGAERARALGFAAVHAATPPSDAAAARPVLEANRVALTGVSTVPVEDLESIAASIDRAATAAAELRSRLVVVEVGGLVLPRRSTVEAAVETLVRAIHAGLRRHPGLSLALATPDGPGRLLGPREVEWLLSALRGELVGLWFDGAGALRLERTEGGATAMSWADRFGSKVLGLRVHGLAGGAGHGPPEDDGPDWGTLRGLVPARAPRVLDLAPSTSAEQIEDSRRYVEHVLCEGA